MTETTRAVLNERFWMPLTKATRNAAREFYQHRVYEEKSCDKCEYRPDRHTELCDECPSYKGEVVLWKKVEKRDGVWIGVPRGDRRLLKKFVGKLKPKIRDLRSVQPMRFPIKFTGKLFPHQKKPLREIIEAGYGVLRAPPRAGKTVMATWLTCKLKKKTLILAAQQEWLDEFYRTFVGDDQNAPMTNVPDIEQFESRAIIKNSCKTVKDFEDHDICLATYQTFITPGGRKKLRQIKKLFGLVIIDEVHGAASPEFSKVLLGLNPRHMVGLTGTPDRKDGLYKIAEAIVGPVTAKAFVQTLIPRVQIVETGASTNHNYKAWVYAMRYLANHKERNALIIKHACHDIKQGRSIVIPVGLVNHAKVLVEGINKKMGKEVAVAFVSQGLTKKRRQEILLGARSYKYKCVVGIRTLVQTGVNVPRWDTLYEVTPISNVPKAMQETSRIRTMSEDKQPPLIKCFLEDFGPSKGCFRTLYFQTFVKEGFLIDDATKELAKKYTNNSRRSGSATRIDFNLA